MSTDGPSRGDGKDRVLGGDDLWIGRASGAPVVFVVGSVNEDLQVRVSCLPRPGQTVTGGDLVRSRGGKGANQAVAAARLGARTTMWGCVGRDEAGAAAVAGLVEAGVDVSAVSRSPARPTGSALIVVDEAGENSITVAPGANGDLSPAALVDLADRAPAADVLLLQLEVPLSTCVAAARAAAATSVRVVLNAAPLPGDPATLGELLRLVDVLVVNETEAAGLAGAESVDGEGLLPVARALRRTGPSLVVVTLGAAGALVAGESLEGHVPGVAVDAVDSVGAGDSFCAALAVSLAVDPDPVLAVRRACAAGALAVTRPGAQPSLPTRAEVEGLLSEVDARGPRRAP